jgi:hypothetical protein
VIFKERPSFAIFKAIVTANPQIKQYRISPGFIKYLAQRTLHFAEDNGITFISSNIHQGRPDKYTNAERQRIKNSKRTAKEISKMHGIPLRTVYFIKGGY